MEAMSPRSPEAVRLVLTTTWQDLWAGGSTKCSGAVKPFSLCRADPLDPHPTFCASSREH